MKALLYTQSDDLLGEIELPGTELDELAILVKYQARFFVLDGHAESDEGDLVAHYQEIPGTFYDCDNAPAAPARGGR